MQCRRHKCNPWVGKISWKKEWLPTEVFSLVEFHGQRSLAGYSPWSSKESDMAEQWEGGYGLVCSRGSRRSAGEYPPGLRAWHCTVIMSWHCQGSEMQALHMLDPLGKVLEPRAWVGLAARVPWKKVPSSGAHSWTLSSFQALRTNLVYDDRLNSLRNMWRGGCLRNENYRVWINSALNSCS